MCIRDSLNHDEGWGMLSALVLFGVTAFLCFSAERWWRTSPPAEPSRASALAAPFLGAAAWFTRVTSDASYLIYLLQFPAFVLLSCAIRYFAPWIYNVRLGWEISQTIMIVTFLLPVSYLLHLAIERPAIRVGHKIR